MNGSFHGVLSFVQCGQVFTIVSICPGRLDFHTDLWARSLLLWIPVFFFQGLALFRGRDNYTNAM